MAVTQIRGDSQLQNNTLTNDSLTSRTNTLTLATVSNGDVKFSPNGTGQIDANSHKIKNLSDPISAQDAATKAYVDGLVNGLSWKQPSLAATTSSLVSQFPGDYTATSTTLTENTPSDGSITPQDGVTLTVGSRLLVKNETGAEAPNNGIYVVTTLGDGATVAWVLTRANDMTTWAEVPAAATFIEEGSTNADSAYVCTSDPGGTLGTTNITFVKFTQTTSSVIAGSGIDVSGVTVSISTDNSLTANAANSTPSLQVKLDAAGAIFINGSSGLAVQLESSNPTLQITSDKLGVKLDGSRAITTGASGIGVNVDNSTIDISGNAIEVKTGGITNTQVSASAAIAFSKLASLTSAHILLGNGSNVATDTAVSGDVSITNAGVTSISSGLATHFVTREVPSGTINGSNATFTLANTPTLGTESVYLNGLLQNIGGGNDYTISSATITFNTAPSTGSVILVSYQK